MGSFIKWLIMKQWCLSVVNMLLPWTWDLHWFEVLEYEIHGFVPVFFSHSVHSNCCESKGQVESRSLATTFQHHVPLSPPSGRWSVPTVIENCMTQVVCFCVIAFSCYWYYSPTWCVHVSKYVLETNNWMFQGARTPFSSLVHQVGRGQPYFSLSGIWKCTQICQVFVASRKIDGFFKLQWELLLLGMLCLFPHILTSSAFCCCLTRFLFIYWWHRDTNYHRGHLMIN